jgi:hypothetical protein
MEEDKEDAYRFECTSGRSRIPDERQKSFNDFKEAGRGVLITEKNWKLKARITLEEFKD